MCGRFAAVAPTGELLERFHAAPAGEVEDHVPSWNVAPSLPVRTVIHHRRQGRVLAYLKWGLVPHWAEDPAIGNRLTVARAETAATKPAFRQALARRRAIVPADGFYEWKVVPDGTKRGGRAPFWFTRRDSDVVAMGALWETWRRPDSDEELLRTLCLITTAGNEDLDGVHDRMPVILEPDEWDDWLDPEVQESEITERFLQPKAYARLNRHPVDRAVNKTDVDGPELIAPAERLELV
jgi:putative SOS response-associated peptidase YedK